MSLRGSRLTATSPLSWADGIEGNGPVTQGATQSVRWGPAWSPRKNGVLGGHGPVERGGHDLTVRHLDEVGLVMRPDHRLARLLGELVRVAPRPLLGDRRGRQVVEADAERLARLHGDGRPPVALRVLAVRWEAGPGPVVQLEFDGCRAGCRHRLSLALLVVPRPVLFVGVWARGRLLGGYGKRPAAFVRGDSRRLHQGLSEADCVTVRVGGCGAGFDMDRQPHWWFVERSHRPLHAQGPQLLQSLRRDVHF